MQKQKSRLVLSGFFFDVCFDRFFCLTKKKQGKCVVSKYNAKQIYSFVFILKGIRDFASLSSPCG
jgi:hypothetical protein